LHTDITTSDALRERHRAIRETQSQALATRLHRSLSWLQRAEQDTGDEDTRFIHLWIALNAAYASEFSDEREHARMGAFLERIVAADHGQRLHALLFRQFSGPIRLLIDNRYVFAPFWQALREHDASDRWKRAFERSRKDAMDALLAHRTAELLGIVLRRLYVLRNQLVHGGATWNSSVNRAQLRDGCAILGALLPLCIELMMATDAFDDDPVAYPVITELTRGAGR
jgi:hypothetical protein